MNSRMSPTQGNLHEKKIDPPIPAGQAFSAYFHPETLLTCYLQMCMCWIT